MLKAARVSVFSLLTTASVVHANGSVGFEQADAFLKQAPEIRAYLMDTFCIAESGEAVRVASDYPLGGMRIAPYRFQARPKGEENGPRFDLWITTWQTGYDANGNEIIGHPSDPYPPFEKTYSLKETFKAAELRVPQDWTPGLAAVNCDEKV